MPSPSCPGQVEHTNQSSGHSINFSITNNPDYCLDLKASRVLKSQRQNSLSKGHSLAHVSYWSCRAEAVSFPCFNQFCTNATDSANNRIMVM